MFRKKKRSRGPWKSVLRTQRSFDVQILGCRYSVDTQCLVTQRLFEGTGLHLNRGSAPGLLCAFGPGIKGGVIKRLSHEENSRSWKSRVQHPLHKCKSTRSSRVQKPWPFFRFPNGVVQKKPGLHRYTCSRIHSSGSRVRLSRGNVKESKGTELTFLGEVSSHHFKRAVLFCSQQTHTFKIWVTELHKI